MFLKALIEHNIRRQHVPVCRVANNPHGHGQQACRRAHRVRACEQAGPGEFVQHAVDRIECTRIQRLRRAGDLLSEQMSPNNETCTQTINRLITDHSTWESTILFNRGMRSCGQLLIIIFIIFIIFYKLRILSLSLSLSISQPLSMIMIFIQKVFYSFILLDLVIILLLIDRVIKKKLTVNSLLDEMKRI